LTDLNSLPFFPGSGRKVMNRIILVVASLSALAACGDTFLERTVTGAAIGGGAAAVTGNDVATGVAIGAGAGAVSDIIR